MDEQGANMSGRYVFDKVSRTLVVDGKPSGQLSPDAFTLLVLLHEAGEMLTITRISQPLSISNKSASNLLHEIGSALDIIGAKEWIKYTLRHRGYTFTPVPRAPVVAVENWKTLPDAAKVKYFLSLSPPVTVEIIMQQTGFSRATLNQLLVSSDPPGNPAQRRSDGLQDTGLTLPSSDKL